MDILTNKASSVDQARLNAISKSKDLPSEKKRLHKAAKDMEALFIYQLLSTMRKTIPKSGFSETQGFGGGLGKDIYTKMFDQEIASKMAGVNNRSIADQIYKSLEKVLDDQYSEKNNVTVNTTDLLPRKNYLKITQTNPSESVKIEPVNRRLPASNDDPISKYKTIIDQVSKKYHLNPSLVTAVIKAESNGNPRAVSHAGAKGLMQLVDTTATDMGVQNVFDPRENIEGGVKYLRLLIDRFGDIKTALAAYNAGPGTVDRYEGIPPYRETNEYIKSVLRKVNDEKPYY